jgi:hypothetical protein
MPRSESQRQVAKRRQISTSVDESPQDGRQMSADILSCAAAAIAVEIEYMAETFRNDRSGCVDTWDEFEVAEALVPSHYTLVPPHFYERLAQAVLRTVAPCPTCRGRGHGEIAPDFIGDDPRTMTIGTVSMCQLCGGNGVDPNFRIVRNAECVTGDHVGDVTDRIGETCQEPS